MGCETHRHNEFKLFWLAATRMTRRHVTNKERGAKYQAENSLGEAISKFRRATMEADKCVQAVRYVQSRGTRLFVVLIDFVFLCASEVA